MIIDAEIAKFLQKRIIKLSASEPGEVISPIFITPISKLGFQIHPEKSVLIPTQCIEFLGFLLDSTSMMVRFTSPKRDKLVQMCQRFLQPNKLYTIRQVASLIGSLISSFPRVEFGPLHYRALEADKDSHLRMHQGHFDALMSLSAGSLDDLNWWVFHLPSASKNISHSPPNIILHTDASGIGWGATLSNGSTTRDI